MSRNSKKLLNESERWNFHPDELKKHKYKLITKSAKFYFDDFKDALKLQKEILYGLKMGEFVYIVRQR